MHAPASSYANLVGTSEPCRLVTSSSQIIDREQIFEYINELCVETRYVSLVPPVIHFASEHGIESIGPQCFPQKDDNCLSEYANRVRSDLRTSNFILYIRNFNHICPELLPRAIGNIEELYPSVDLGRYHIEIEIYVGIYPWTAIGVHRENCANLHQVIYNAKYMHIWPRSSLSPKSERPEIAMHGGTYEEATEFGYFVAEGYQSFQIAAGKMLFFPAGCWHVGSSPELSAAVDVAIFPV